MKRFVLLVWFMLPVAALAYHLGPGQTALIRDRADDALRVADADAAAERWPEAVAHYEDALELLGDEPTTAQRRVRLELAKAKMLAAQLPAARDDLESLVAEMAADGNADVAMMTEAREALASAQYYRTWLMRLEGQPRELWEPEIESARQTYKLLVEEAENDQDAEASRRQRENLESSIRLARMDLKDLQGLPLPSQ